MGGGGGGVRGVRGRGGRAQFDLCRDRGRSWSGPFHRRPSYALPLSPGASPSAAPGRDGLDALAERKQAP